MTDSGLTSNTLKILAFDTSTEWCSVALNIDGKLNSRTVQAGQKHSELLLPMVQDVLAEVGMTLAQLDALAIGQGPGSFTGLRIACGVAQGLAFGAGLPVIEVGTLQAMAAQTLAETTAPGVVVCLDARMNEVYAAVYRRSDSGVDEVVPPGLYAPTEAPLPAEIKGFVGCGSGFAAAYADLLHSRYGNRLSAIRSDLYPNADWVARLAAGKWQAAEYVAAEAVEPLYIRDKVALKTCER